MRVSRLVSVLVVGLLAVGGCDDEDDGGGNGGPPCPDRGTPLFTALPLRAEDFRSFVPLGNFNPSGHVLPTGHHYLYLTDHTRRVSVRAPGRMWITSVSSLEHSTYTDYGMSFELCGDVTGNFGHLSALSVDVMAAIGGTFADGECDSYEAGGVIYHMCRKWLRLEVAAGTVIGEAGGNPGQYALDFGVVDLRVSQTFANPGRFIDSYLHAVPCLDYYDAANRPVLESKCDRTIPPIGGTVAQDVPGTAQGVWFRSGTPTYPESPHLALAHDNEDPTEIAFVAGTSIDGLPSQVYTFTIAGSGYANRSFADVRPDGHIYTYSGLRGAGIPAVVVLLRLIEENTLWVEAQAPSSGPPWSFTAGHTEFER